MEKINKIFEESGRFPDSECVNRFLAYKKIYGNRLVLLDHSKETYDVDEVDSDSWLLRRKFKIADWIITVSILAITPGNVNITMDRYRENGSIIETRSYYNESKNKRIIGKLTVNDIFKNKDGYCR